MISSPFYTYRWVHFTSENMLRFVIFVCLSVTCLRFTKYWNMVGSSFFCELLPLTLWNGSVILKSKVKGRGHWEQHVKIFLTPIFIKSRSIEWWLANYTHNIRRKCIVLVIICNYLRELHDKAATRLCTYLLCLSEKSHKESKQMYNIVQVENYLSS